MFPPPKHHLQERRTSAQDQEAGEARDQEVDHNSHPTLTTDNSWSRVFLYILRLH